MIKLYRKRIAELTKQYEGICLRAMHNPHQFQYYTLRLTEIGTIIEMYTLSIIELEKEQ